MTTDRSPFEGAPHTVEARLGEHTIRFETGRIARQADGAVVVRCGDAWVLAAVVARGDGPPRDFLPLTVEYRERMAAVGRIPGNYFRRETRQNEGEILVSRLIDRSLRPLFPAGYCETVQLSVTVFSADRTVDLPSLAILAAGAALHISDIPFDGPVAGAAFVRQGHDLYPMPPADGPEPGTLELTLSATPKGVVMLEAGSSGIAGPALAETIAGATYAFGSVFEAMDALRVAVGAGTRTVEPMPDPHEPPSTAARADGRAPDALRPLAAEIGLLPGTHGSALFTRGRTQALATATLGGARDARDQERLHGNASERFMLHYNFPSYSVGELGGPRGGPGRREIGHGNLAQRALTPVLPDAKAFPYTVRVTSDITESDGSSSMATVCAASLALMDAGVPIETPVAGVSLGLVEVDGAPVLLTDLTAAEDHAGRMDLKVAGTAEHLTALQLDNKIGSLSIDILTQALTRARTALNVILAHMDSTIETPRARVASHAPQFARTRISPDQVGALVGTGGKRIQDIQTATRTRIDVRDDGEVKIHGRDVRGLEEALRRVQAAVVDLADGRVYRAIVTGLKDYGAFVRIGEHEGLVHVSELADPTPATPEVVVQIGDFTVVRVLGRDKRGRVRLSRKAALGVDPSEVIEV